MSNSSNSLVPPQTLQDAFQDLEAGALSLSDYQELITSLEFQGEAIERTLELLPDDKSMIGFIGGPWTLLSFASAKNKLDKLGKIESYQWAILEEYIYPLLHKNISLQLQAGAELVMIFSLKLPWTNPSFLFAKIS